ncbi:hypothetical protein GCM10023219_24380 [Stakelama sediminis]
MSMLDGLLGQVAGNIDLKNLAEKVGISPEQAEAAVQALAQAHTAPGDTAQTAADSTGLPVAKIIAIIEQIGGEGALGRFAQLLEGQQGGIGGALGGMASGLFGKS